MAINIQDFKSKNPQLANISAGLVSQMNVPKKQAPRDNTDTGLAGFATYPTYFEQPKPNPVFDTNQKWDAGSAGISYANGEIPQAYYDKLLGVESNGKWDAYNVASGAYGGFQFVSSTERAYMKKLGLTQEQARTVDGQNAMVRALTNDNRRGLISAGYEPTERNLYMAHQQGLGGARDILAGGSGNQAHLQANGVNSVDEWMNKFAPRFA